MDMVKYIQDKEQVDIMDNLIIIMDMVINNLVEVVVDMDIVIMEVAFKQVVINRVELVIMFDMVELIIKVKETI